MSISNGKAMILSKCVICGSKKSRFIKDQEGKGLISNLGIRALLSKVQILGDILLWSATSLSSINNEWNSKQVFVSIYDTFIPEMHLKQPGFTYSTCRSSTKNKERIQKFKETGDTNYIYKNELHKACFDMAWHGFWRF